MRLVRAWAQLIWAPLLSLLVLKVFARLAVWLAECVALRLRRNAKQAVQTATRRASSAFGTSAPRSRGASPAG